MFCLTVLVALLLAVVALGAFAVFMVLKRIQADNAKLSAQNAEILKTIAAMKETKIEETSEATEAFEFEQTDVIMDEDDSAVDSDCQRSSSLSDCSVKTTSSGYDSPFDKEMDIDWDYELYKISVAPVGPVPETQVLLTVTCPLNKQYVKAFTDLDETIVEIATYAPESSEDDSEAVEFRWKRAECPECLEYVEESLKATGCQIPFAEEGDIDWEAAYVLESNDKDADKDVDKDSDKKNNDEEITDKDTEEEATDKKIDQPAISFTFEEPELEYDLYDLTVSYHCVDN